MLCMIVLLYRIIRKMERGKGAARGGSFPRMTVGAGNQFRDAGSFLRKELGEALRIGPAFMP